MMEDRDVETEALKSILSLMKKRMVDEERYEGHEEPKKPKNALLMALAERKGKKTANEEL